MISRPVVGLLWNDDRFRTVVVVFVAVLLLLWSIKRARLEDQIQMLLMAGQSSTMVFDNHVNIVQFVLFG